MYICRDNSDMKSYLFKVTDDMRNELVDKINTCDDYINKMQVPPRPENAGDNLCKYCGYYHSCVQDN